MLPCVVALLRTVLVAATLLDAFEVELLPRPVRHRARLNRYLFLGMWRVWSLLATRLPAGRRRENFIGVCGPLSMVSLFMLWAICMIASFGLLQWAVREATVDGPSETFAREMIVSGDAFFTLGYGDMVLRTLAARLLVITEAGTGFAFIALTISYLPVLCQHFAQRDANHRVRSSLPVPLRRRPATRMAHCEKGVPATGPLALELGIVDRKTDRKPFYLADAGILPLPTRRHS